MTAPGSLDDSKSAPAPPPEPDWSCLDRLRRGFLDGTAGAQDYWRQEEDLAQYDATFAQRIGWKWDHVLRELQQRGWRLPPGDLVDWGCGSGIATRAVLDHLGRDGITGVRWVDRSPLATRFAAMRLAVRHPGVPSGPGWVEAPGTVLVSHVLTELQPDQTEQLVDQLRSATAVLWVEPGTYEASLALIAIRERLRETFGVVAPCPHRGRCGILAPGNERHWCHHFARPPANVFTDAFWGQFSHFLGIDLRSLPLSFLVLDRRWNPPVPEPAGPTRILGRPEVLKAHVRFMGCSAAGVSELDVPKRSHPRLWKAARKERHPALLPDLTRDLPPADATTEGADPADAR